jgi:hypothetical protein
MLLTSPNCNLDLLSIHTRLYNHFWARGWPEPVDLPLLLSQTEYNWSQDLVDADADSARLDMVVKFGSCDQLKLSHLDRE